MFSLFSAKKFNKKESLLILYAIKSSLHLGISLTDAVALQAKSNRGKSKKILGIILYLIKTKKKRVSEVFYEFGIISKEEQAIVENARDIRKSIFDIIEMREISGAFDRTLFGLVFMPIIAVVIGLVIAQKVVPIFTKPLNAINQILKIKGVDMSADMQIPDIFWYINHYDWINPVLLIYCFSILLLISVYIYLRNYKPNLIYKIFKLSAYDDAPFILMYMRALHKTGLSPVSIAEILSKSNIRHGWKTLFLNIKLAVKSSRAINAEFKKFGFPDEITNFIKYAEEAKSFWENIDNLIKFTMERNEDGNKFIKKYFGGLSTLFGFGIIIYFLIGIFIIMLQIQTVSTSMMG